MQLEFFETSKINCGVEESAGKTTCPNDAFAIAHFKNFSFDGNEIFPSSGAESVVPICADHRSRLETEFREVADQNTQI